ncbi:hypothetical protein CSZ94_12210 [Janthinobacterium sp. ROICE36]|uniref:hemerythrin domain-containing protein n=1 Tax=Janthinobacterium sp. ROICE36 TaxID=2048670 RepID=UPI000C7F1EED|nr:hemerythrin domain-containing protein [Janthinobacterium sp. ROICE36]PLY42134.1 hypothetical protein CSZ94_12210 [Janthinobacterium sp. ROICE36]
MTSITSEAEPKNTALYVANKRFNLYKIMHKYIRSEINCLAELCGKTDFLDERESTLLKTGFDNLFELLSSHAENEDKYIHPLLEEIKSDQLPGVMKQHGILEALFLDLKNNLDCLLNSTTINEEDVDNFYLKLIQFQSLYFNHLDDEETKITPELYRNFKDDRLVNANSLMLRNMSAHRMIAVTKGMLSKINHQELVAIYSEMKKAMPAEAFKQMCALAKESLETEPFEKMIKFVN